MKKKTSFFIPLIFLVIFFATVFISIKLSIIPFVLFVASLFLSKGKNNKAEIDKLTKEKEKLISEKEISEKNLSRKKDELESSKKKLMEMKVREETLKLTAEGNDGDINELYKKKEKLEKKLRTISLVSKALSCAYENMQKNFTPALNKKASSYFGKITGGKYERIFCSKEFSVSVENTIPRESGFFSGGTIDQLYLSLRLALIDMIFVENMRPVILDQPFLQYDEERKKNTISLFEDIKESRQIILFTADKSLPSRNI